MGGGVGVYSVIIYSSGTLVINFELLEFVCPGENTVVPRGCPLAKTSSLIFRQSSEYFADLKNVPPRSPTTAGTVLPHRDVVPNRDPS